LHQTFGERRLGNSPLAFDNVKKQSQAILSKADALLLKPLRADPGDPPWSDCTTFPGRITGIG
jgi:hypothetical protein